MPIISITIDIDKNLYEMIEIIALKYDVTIDEIISEILDRGLYVEIEQ